MLVAERFRCSLEAVPLWGRLRRLWGDNRDLFYRDRNRELVNVGGDAQQHGVNWAERAPIVAMGIHSELGTDARLTLIAAQRALAGLETMGVGPTIAVALATRRLDGQSLTGLREKHGLSKCDRQEKFCTGCELHAHLQGVKQWLWWSLSEEALELPILPW